MKRTCLVAALALWAGAASAQPRPDLRGVWWPSSPQPALQPQGGGSVPLTEAGRKAQEAYAARQRASAGKPVGRDDLTPCLPLGPTRILSADYPMQIIQKDDQFVIVYEHNHAYEQVWLGEKPDPERDWAYMGNSVGEWSADGIVITTVGVKDTVVLDDAGLPHGEKLVLRRVLRKIDGGRQLEVLTTVTDPEMYTRPWTVRHTLALKPGERIQEYTCGQGPTLETRYTRALPPPPPPVEPPPRLMRPLGGAAGARPPGASPYGTEAPDAAPPGAMPQRPMPPAGSAASAPSR